MRRLLQVVLSFATLGAAVQVGALQVRKIDDAATETWIECEDTGGCGELSFHGSSGYGEWPVGAAASLTLDKLDDNSVQFTRKDLSGIAKGVTAVYTGTRQGNQLQGTVNWTWPGHGSGTTNWQARMLKGPKPTKTTLTGWLECEDFGSSCDGPTPKVVGVWSLDGRFGLERRLDVNFGTIQLIVEQSDPTSIVILRVDASGPTAGATAVYFGTLHGNMMSGTATWYWFGHFQHPMNGKWAAFVPGLDYSCDSGQATADEKSALLIGAGLLLLGHNPAAFGCYSKAALSGDAAAQNELGYLLLNGIGTKADSAGAVNWWKKSADQGNAIAARNLSQAYAKGIGTARDDLKANYWADQAKVLKYNSDLSSGWNDPMHFFDRLAGLAMESNEEKQVEARAAHEEAVIRLMDQTRMSREEAESWVGEREARQAAEEQLKEKEREEEDYQRCKQAAYEYYRSGERDDQLEICRDKYHKWSIY